MQRFLAPAACGITGASLLSVALLLPGALPIGHPISASSSTGTSRCQHAGGGLWEQVFNNSSAVSPTDVWVPTAGYYWAGYNNTTGAMGQLGWGTPGVRAIALPGETLVNMSATNQTSTAEAMMEYGCENPAGGMPWHYDFGSGLFVRDP